MVLHDLRDIVDIYYTGKDGKVDYTWDRTPIKVWNSDEQRQMEIYFTGSSRPSEGFEGEINFNTRYLDEIGDQCVFKGYRETLRKIFPNITDETLKEYEKMYLETILELRKQKRSE